MSSSKYRDILYVNEEEVTTCEWKLRILANGLIVLSVRMDEVCGWTDVVAINEKRELQRVAGAPSCVATEGDLIKISEDTYGYR